MTDSTSVISSNKLEEKFLDNLEKKSDLESNGTNEKDSGAFRTISEVAEEIQVPQHVLRFWETRFKQVQPTIHGDGQSYYRNEDIALLRYISELLYVQGYTVKAVQRLLNEDFSRFTLENTVTELDSQIENSELSNSSTPKEHVISDESYDIVTQNQSNTSATLQRCDVEQNLEFIRLKEENEFLLRSLQSVLIELQELRKIIISDC